MQPVLVTGVSGFIAQQLARALQAQGEEVIGVSRRPPTGHDLPWQAIDLTDFAAVRELLGRVQPRTIYHLAAISVLQAADGPNGAREMLETNIAGTWNLLEAARQVGVEQVVVASSDKQYGALAVPPYDDDDTTAFLNGGLYELSKAQQDQIARLYAGLYERPAIRVARLANVYGPGDRSWNRIVPGTIRRLVQGIAPRITAGRAGEALREYVFIDDAIVALIALAEDARERGNLPLRRDDGRLARVAFNIGSEHRHAAGDVIGRIQALLAMEFGVIGPTPEVLPSPQGVFEPGSQFSQHARLRAILPDYAPRPLDDGLRQTIPWYLAVLAQE